MEAGESETMSGVERKASKKGKRKRAMEKKASFHQPHSGAMCIKNKLSQS